MLSGDKMEKKSQIAPVQLRMVAGALPMSCDKELVCPCVDAVNVSIRND
jgi:hypothetical protein